MTQSEKRIIALQNLLAREELDGLLLATGASLAYLLDLAELPFQRTSETKNQRGAPSVEALNAPDCLLWISREGESRLFCVPWREGDLAASPIPAAAEYAGHLPARLRPCLTGRSFAVGDCCAPWLAGILNDALPGCDVRPGEALVEELRRYKDDGELAKLRAAAAVTDEIMGKAVARLRPGITSREMEALLVRLGREAGAQDLAFAPGVLFTKKGHPSAQTITGHPHDLPFAPGSSAAFDFGYVIDGYCSDFGRSFYCGRAPEHLREGYQALQEAQCRMISGIVPGKTNLGALDGMVREELTRMGFGEYMTNKDRGVIGHQIGIDVHEMPWINRSVDFVIQPGMVFCCEPKMWFPGECYLRVEDMVAVTETGAVSLTTYDRQQFQLPAG